MYAITLSGIEAQIDRHNAIMHARRNPEPDTRPKFHVVSFKSRAKAIAMREWGYNNGFQFGVAKRGALYHDGRYTKTQVAVARRLFEKWWKAALANIDREA